MLPGLRFDPDRYTVELAPDDTRAKQFVVEHHYAASYPAARYRVLLHDHDGLSPVLVGVAVFAVPCQARVLTQSFPTLEPYLESLELARFVLLDEVPANAESWFLARAFALIRAEGIRGVVSFSDPVPRRRADGSLLMPGHVGTIYQAANGLFDARRSTPRTLLLGPDGRVLSPRALQKIRRTEQGHVYATRQLVEWGATPPAADTDPAAWLENALVEAGVRRLRHPGNLRYLFRLGRSRRERERITVHLTPGAYPKRRSLPELDDASPIEPKTGCP